MKRRLQLMPEVLPSPTKVEASGPSPVRTRTMARLKALAAVGAGIAAACGGNTTSTPGGGSSSSGNGGPDGGLPDPTKPDTGPGYGVVDPLPTPACFDYATPPTATAAFVDPQPYGYDPGAADAGPNGPVFSRYVHVVVTLNQKDVAVGSVELQNQAAELLKTQLDEGTVGLLLGQRDGDTEFQANIQIQTSCAKGPTRVFVGVSSIPNSAGKFDVSVSFTGG